MTGQNLSTGGIPDQLKLVLTNYFKMFPPHTEDFTQPVLRPSLKEYLPFFITLYGLLIVGGVVSNITMVLNIVRRKLYDVDSVCALLLNIAFCNIIISVIVLPLSLSILLIQNWVFGRTLCYVAPMLQDVPVHASTATFVVMAMERFRVIVMTSRRKRSLFNAILGIWAVAICVVLPYTVYMEYLDVEKYLGSQLAGVGICNVSFANKIATYIRCLFVGLYAFPLLVISYLHTRVGSHIQTLEESSNTMALGQSPYGGMGLPPSRGSRQSRESRGSHGDLWTTQEGNPSTPSTLLPGPDMAAENRRHSSFVQVHGSGPKDPTGRGRHPSIRPLEEDTPDETPLQAQRRDQRFLASMIMVFAFCLCPLMILRLVKNMVVETHANSAHFDLTFITFVWVAFLPTITTPAIFAVWRHSTSPKDGAEGYHNFSGGRSCPFPPTPSTPAEEIQRYSTIPYGHESSLYTHNVGMSPREGVGMSGHRLSVEGSLLVHGARRSLTPTPSFAHDVGKEMFAHEGGKERFTHEVGKDRFAHDGAKSFIQNPSYGHHRERYTRPHSLSISN